MSTTVCRQNLLSCFESETTTTTTTLKLKVAPPPPPPPATPALDHKNPEFGNWSLIQTVPNDYHYYNKSFSKLSPKSLELCTENLGSETGSDTASDSSSIFSSSPPYTPTSKDIGTADVGEWIPKPKNTHQKERNTTKKSFPPPLTTMTGSSSLQVRRHTEDGRLIIEAVEAPFRNSYLQAERSDGRLKLCFFTTADDDDEEEECDGDEEIESEFEGEIKMEKFQRLSRCKEGSSHGGNKGLCSNWKPALWVATS